MTAFDLYAHYYNLFYQDKDYAGETRFVDDLLKRYMPSANTILEFGCGTGRYSAELADLGYEIIGIDLSREMIIHTEKYLEQLAGKIRKKITCIQGDIRDINLQQHFDAVISLFHVISYQVTNEDLLASFHTARSHLNKDGIFIFDCWYGPAVLSDPPTNRIRKLEDDTTKISRIAKPVMFPAMNMVEVNYDFIVMDKKTMKYNEFSEIHRMRYLFEPEVKLMLETSGFTLIKSTDWLSKRKPGLDTWNVAFVAKAI